MEQFYKYGDLFLKSYEFFIYEVDVFEIKSGSWCLVDNYFIKRACNSVDLDVEKKLKHEINIENCNFDNYNIGLIVGLSGSGKSTLAKNE
jgi:serine kinase of HPr protein (carbohydrate metabolism regulator)